MRYFSPPVAAFAQPSIAARGQSNGGVVHVSASPLTGTNLQPAKSLVRRSSDDAPATCVRPSSRTKPFEPKTWKLKAGPVAVNAPRYPDIPFLNLKIIDVVSSESTSTTRRKLRQ